MKPNALFASPWLERTWERVKNGLTRKVVIFLRVLAAD